MNEKIIWDFFIRYTDNPYGTAAIMGNLMAESSLNPKNVTGAKDSDYVAKADAGSIDFVHDGHAFGLAQWCFWSRKQSLFDYAKSRNQSVGDLNMQLDHIYNEMTNSYKSVWKAVIEAKDIRSASDIVMLKYEKPANTSEAMKKKRANYGKQFYDMFVSSSKQEEKQSKNASKQVVVQTGHVNIRAGNGKEFQRISQANKNDKFDWIATSQNGWYAIRLSDRVAWISGEFSKLN